MTIKTLLVELITEELPPAILLKISQDFAHGVLTKLSSDSLTTSNSKMRVYASPRRIGFQITKVKQRADNSRKEIKLLPKKIAIDKNGEPTEILKKKFYSFTNLSTKENKDSNKKNFTTFILDSVTTKLAGKEEFLFIELDEIGVEITDSLQSAIVDSIKNLQVPRVMTYQILDKSNNFADIKFIRPAHKLLVMHGEKILKVKVLGLESAQFSDGHRFLGEKNLKIDNADDYEVLLQKLGKVIPNFDDRKSKIKNQLMKKTNLENLVITEELLDEITALCEWPVVYEGVFDKKFLNLPQECLILTMQKNQKFIPLKTKKNTLSNRFFIVSNIFTSQPKNIIVGNERVLKARLSDAQFFFNVDKKENQDENVSRLSKVIYHNKLGNIYDRTLRLVSLTSKWGTSLGLDKKLCERAAFLSKADLVSKMVNEFPELQGVMGKYYAMISNESFDVYTAIEEHYKPKFSGDNTPKNILGSCLGLADRIENIVGLWSIGVLPTGEKDPMGLRRNAIAVVRILIENQIKLNLNDLIVDVAKNLNQENFIKTSFKDIKDFFMDRLKNWLKENGHQPAHIEAAIAKCDNKLNELPERLNAIIHFLSFPLAYDLCSTNKRIKNILKKNIPVKTLNIPDPALFENDAEMKLFEKLNIVESEIEKFLEKSDYKQVLTTLSELKKPVDNFFQNVLVNTNNDLLKTNRICLLRKLHETMNQVAELSLLVE